MRAPLIALSLAIATAVACEDSTAPALPLSIQPAPTNSGDGQIDTAAATLSRPLRIQVLREGRPAPDVDVGWEVSVGSIAPTATKTDASGIATTVWTLGDIVGMQVATAFLPGRMAVHDSSQLQLFLTAIAQPGAPVRLDFLTIPGNAVTALPLSPAINVAAADRHGYPTDFQGRMTVAVGSGPPGATLSGPTLADATSGVATFAGLSLDRPGLGYTLIAHADGFSNAISPPFDVRLPPNSIVLAPNLIGVDLGTTVPVTATVANDGSNAGVNWTLTGPGCVHTACGTLSAASSASGVPVIYTAPAAPPIPATVVLRAVSVADPTASASATGVITTPGLVSVYVAPATAGVLVNGSRTFVGTVFNGPAQGGVTWTLSCTGPCGTLSSTSSASGVAVTFQAPSSPTTNTLTATSVSDPGKFATVAITVFRPHPRI
jgi:hypothetical protein